MAQKGHARVSHGEHGGGGFDGLSAVVVIVLLTERSHPARKNHYTDGKGGLHKNIDNPTNNLPINGLHGFIKLIN